MVFSASALNAFSQDDASKAFLSKYLGGMEAENSSNFNFQPSTDETVAFGLPGKPKIGNIPPQSNTTFLPGNNLLGFFGLPNSGDVKVPYKEQEYGLYRTGGAGYAPPGVTLSGGRSFKNPGTSSNTGFGVPTMNTGVSPSQERSYRTPFDRMRLGFQQMFH